MGVIPTPTNFKTLTFDGENSRSYGVYITGEGVFNAPERNVEMVEIPGRNGAFALDKGNFNNIEVTYPAGIFADTEADFAQAVSDFRNLLCSKVGYVRLEDDYNPNEYRLAIYKSGLEVDHDLLIAGEFDLVFECKPQRYLKSGETPITIGEYSEVVGTDNTPYLFRRTPQFSGEYDSEMPTLVGGTVVWNQLVQNGNFADSSSWTIPTGTPTFSNNSVTIAFDGSQANVPMYQSITQKVQGHKVLVEFDAVASAQQTINVYWGSALFTEAIQTTKKHIAKIATVGSGNTNFNLQVYGVSASASVTYSNVRLTDITAMFGTTIAEQAYTMEQATAESGIAWLKSYGFFTDSYYAYATPNIESVEAVKHITTGKNLLKPSTLTSGGGTGVTATVNDDGSITLNGTPNATQFIGFQFTIGVGRYILSGCPSGGGASTYQANFRQTLGGIVVTTDTGSGGAFNPEEEMTLYYSIRIASGANVTGKTFYPMLRLSSVPDATYEPYIAHEYTLDSDLVLRGIPKLDASNNLYYDGDTYESDGTVTRKYGVVDLGTLTWSYDSSAPMFYNNFSMAKASENDNSIGNIFCPKYQTTYRNNLQRSNVNKAISINSRKYISVKDTAYTDATAFKTAMSGVYLVYELATPTTETADAFTSPQVCDPNGTEEYTTNTLLPVGHVTEYGLNPYVLRNPTRFDAQPLLEIEGYGNVNFNGYNIELFDDLVGNVFAELQTSYTLPYSTYLGNIYVNANDVITTHPTGLGNGFSFSAYGERKDGYTAAINSYTATNIQCTGISTSNVIVSAWTDTDSFECMVGFKNVDFSALTEKTITVSWDCTLIDSNGDQFKWYPVATVHYDGVAFISYSFTGLDFPNVFYMSGNPTVGLLNIQIQSTATTYGHPTMIDCETGETYTIQNGVAMSLGRYVSLGSELPTFASGANTITYDNTITSLKLTPRWWQV